MITGTVFICDRMTNVLFDPAFTYSYVSMSFASDFEIMCDVFDTPIRVSTPIEESIIVTHVYRACPI